MNKARIRMVTFLIVSLLLMAAGCSQQPYSTPVPSASPANDYLNIDPDRRPVPQKITLYYMHKASELLVPVTRTEYKGDTTMERFVMDELMKGPQGSESQALTALFPEGTTVTDVAMTGTTALVYFDSRITGDLPLQSILGDAYSNQDPMVLEQKTRELMLYSIVNTLTELPGIANVKILIENHFTTYEELGLESLAEANGVEADTSMPSFARNIDKILQPDDVVSLLMAEWNSTAQPKWQKIYQFLYPTLSDGTTSLPGVEEMQRQWAGSIRSITVNPESIVTQEMRGDNTALVAVSYAIERANGQIQTVNLEYLHMFSQNGVWKLVLPPHWLDDDYGY